MSIRETPASDKRVVLDVVEEEQAQFVAQMFDDHHSAESLSNQHWLVADVQGEVTGIAYAAPEEMTQGT